MIPRADILEWRTSHPWQSDAQVEQDLVLTWAVTAIFSHKLLSESLALRGGTALHKLILFPSQRYSEDIDLVQREPGPIGPAFDALQDILNPWLGKPNRSVGRGPAVLVYRFQSEGPPLVPLRLKVEINTREHFVVHGYVRRKFSVQSRWRSGDCEIVTYSLEELLGSKMRALFQRRKGRDLFDLWKGLTYGKANPDAIVEAFRRYMEAEGLTVTRDQFLANIKDKRDHPAFMGDVVPLLAPGVTFDADDALEMVKDELIWRLP